MPVGWQANVQRWLETGLIDSATAGRILASEKERDQQQGLRWPVLLAWSLGGILMGAGVLLFVSAHWDALSPAERFTLVLAMVGVFHVAGALLAGRAAALARVLHAVGTIALGAGIFLAGQIFHLQEHWPGGVMFWALGAWLAWALLADWVQATLAAILTPFWLAGELIVAAERFRGEYRILATGLTLLAVIYFTARTRQHDSTLRRALVWLGGLALIPSTFFLVLQGASWWGRSFDMPAGLSLVAWAVALGLPLAVGNLLSRRIGWQNLAVAVWVVLLGTTNSAGETDSLLLYAWGELGAYLLCGLFSVGLAWWGLEEARRERINMGVAGFGLTVLAFYFSSVMDKLGRAESLISLGVLFLVLGWSLHRARRTLMARLEKAEQEAAE